MKELWRKTADLFWQHPVLWLYVAVADLAGFLVTQIQAWASHRVIVWLVARHQQSVLGSTPESMNYVETLKLTFLVAPLSWARYLICILLYIAAYFLIADCVRPAAMGPVADRSSSYLRRLGNRQTITFAVKMLILYAGTSWLIIGMMNASGNMLLTTPISMWIFAFTVSIVVVYIMTPSGLLLLSPDVFSGDVAKRLKLARISGLMAALTCAVLGAFCSQVAQASAERSHAVPSLWMQAIGSLLTALPYCPLFISLSLLAFEPKPEEAAV
ncbi:MAG TPA: hypothetical protein VGC07_09460 [Granulicella sp.]